MPLFHPCFWYNLCATGWPDWLYDKISESSNEKTEDGRETAAWCLFLVRIYHWMEWWIYWTTPTQNSGGVSCRFFLSNGFDSWLIRDPQVGFTLVSMIFVCTTVVGHPGSRWSLRIHNVIIRVSYWVHWWISFSHQDSALARWASSCISIVYICNIHRPSDNHARWSIWKTLAKAYLISFIRIFVPDHHLFYTSTWSAISCIRNCLCHQRIWTRSRGDLLF